MAGAKIEIALTALIAATIWAGAVAQSSSCTNALISMTTCLSYIGGNSSAPSSSCCTQLGTVVKSQPKCLCQALGGGGGGSVLGMNINQTRAMALPNACNVQTPPISQCNGKSPANSPTTPSGTGSSGSTTPFVLLFVTIFIALASSFTAI